ncbi:MAG: STAS domain-containing protein [Planctomycetota bacterium]
MQIEEHQQAAVSVLSPAGSLVGPDADVLRSRVREAVRANAGRVVLDLTHVTFIDSAGLEAVADLSDEMTAVARTLKIAAANDTLREVLDVTEVGAACDRFDDVGAAVRSFA